MSTNTATEPTIEEWQSAVVRLLFLLQHALPCGAVSFARLMQYIEIADDEIADDLIADDEITVDVIADVYRIDVLRDDRLVMIARRQVEMASRLPRSVLNADAIYGRKSWD